MGARIRVEPIGQDIALLIRDDLSPEAAARAYAAEAARVIDATDAANDAAAGRDVAFETFVDGRAGPLPERIAPSATIVAVWDLGVAMFAEIRDLLEAAAPRRTGRYRSTILFLADGFPADPEAPPRADEYVFVSPQAYARKIERGQKGYAPGAVFEGVSVLAARRYSNIARIRFGFRSLAVGPIAEWADRAKVRSQAPARNRPGVRREVWLTRQPAIIVSLR